MPLVEFAAAELRARGVRSSAIRFEAITGFFYQRQVDLIVEIDGEILLTLIVLTQGGSVRKNLNNRRRDIVGDAVNLRAANPRAIISLVYLLRASEEAIRKGTAGESPIDELATFLGELQTAHTPIDRPLLDAAALLVADREPSGRIRVEPVPATVDVLEGFFDKLAAGLTRNV